MPGGFVTSVVRVGDTVRRLPPARAEFVHALLGLFERHGWGGAPRFLGVDSRGREVLSYQEGHAAWEPVQPAEVGSDQSLARAAELVRESGGLHRLGHRRARCAHPWRPASLP